MTDADRAECEAVWDEINPWVGEDDEGDMVKSLLFAAKRKWEKAAANAKLEEAAEIVEEWDDDFPRLAAKSIRALKQE